MAALAGGFGVGACESMGPTTVAGPAADVSVANGADQAGKVGEMLAISPEVRVTDAAGVPVSGAFVSFVAVFGGGEVLTPVTVTDESGLASTDWRLGTVAGRPQRLLGVVRSVAGGGSALSVTFDAITVPGDPALVSVVSGRDQIGAAGRPLREPLVISVTDGWGNSVPNEPVSWLIAGGGGSLSPASTSTDSAGVAMAVWTLGETSAPQSAVVAVDTLPPLVFEAESGLPSTIDELATMPRPVRAPAAAASDEHLYVVGGTRGGRESALQIFDFASGSWSLGADAPTAMDWASAAFVGGSLHVFGGVTNGEPTTDQHFVYDPETDSWTNGAPLPTPSAGAAVVQAGELVYLIGGIDGLASPSEHTRVYDWTTDTWSLVAPAPDERLTWAAAALADGRILAAGGEAQRRSWNTLWEYDPSADTWVNRPPMSVPREAHGAAVLDGRLCVFGGRDLQTVECYSPEDQVWTKALSLPGVISELVAVRHGDAVYLVGGEEYGGMGKLLRFRFQ